MKTAGKDYLIAVLAPAFPLQNGKFATESAFAKHLVELRRSLDDSFSRLVLLAPQMPEDRYLESQSYLAELSAAEHGIVFEPAYPLDTSVTQFWLRHALPLYRRVRDRVSASRVVHSAVSDDFWRPMMGIVNWVAWWKRRPVIFVVDIDFRRDTSRYRTLGLRGLKSYLVNRLVYDPFKWIQVYTAVRVFDLVLLKSQSMVDDFGKGRTNVRNYYDTVHNEADIITPDDLRSRRQRRQSDRALKAVYFGRLVEYKGLDLTLRAVHAARNAGADLSLKIIGAGESQQGLIDLTHELGLADAVEFIPPVPYGPALFDHLQDGDFAIATPLVEDTPRGAFDAMARGLPIVAFDITYYADLENAQAGVVTGQWPDPESVGGVIVALFNDQLRLDRLTEQAVAFAKRNTHTHWVDTRAEWTREILARLDRPSD